MAEGEPISGIGPSSISRGPGHKMEKISQPTSQAEVPDIRMQRDEEEEVVSGREKLDEEREMWEEFEEGYGNRNEMRMPVVTVELEKPAEEFSAKKFKRAVQKEFSSWVDGLIAKTGSGMSDRPDHIRLGRMMDSMKNAVDSLEIRRSLAEEGEKEVVRKQESFEEIKKRLMKEEKFTEEDFEEMGRGEILKVTRAKKEMKEIEFGDKEKEKLEAIEEALEWSGAMDEFMWGVYTHWGSLGWSREYWANVIMNRDKRVVRLKELSKIREIGPVKEGEMPVEEYWDKAQRMIIATALVSMEAGESENENIQKDYEVVPKDVVKLIGDVLTEEVSDYSIDEDSGEESVKATRTVLNILNIDPKSDLFGKTSKFIKACSWVDAWGRLKEGGKYEEVKSEVGDWMSKMEKAEKSGEVSFGLDFAFKLALADIHFAGIDTKYGWSMKEEMKLKKEEGGDWKVKIGKDWKKTGEVKEGEQLFKKKYDMGGWPQGNDANYLVWSGARLKEDGGRDWPIGPNVLMSEEDVERADDPRLETVFPNGMIPNFYEKVKLMVKVGVENLDVEEMSDRVKSTLENIGNIGEEKTFWELWWREENRHYQLPWTGESEREMKVLRVPRDNEHSKWYVTLLMANRVFEAAINDDVREFQELVSVDKMKKLIKNADIAFGVGSDKAKRMVVGVLAAQSLLFSGLSDQLISKDQREQAVKMKAKSDIGNKIRYLLDEGKRRGKWSSLYNQIIEEGKIVWRD